MDETNFCAGCGKLKLYADMPDNHKRLWEYNINCWRCQLKNIGKMEVVLG